MKTEKSFYTSFIGVRGRVAAGMTVFGYAKLMKPKKLKDAGASIIFDNMKLLLDLIENNIN